jgi:DNA-directed RNA polymerase specialized sigma24 family protein
VAQRKSSIMLEARERARKAAAESMAREDRLLKLGERFFMAAGDQEQIWEAAEKKIQDLRAKAESDTSRAKAEQSGVISAMKAEGLSAGEIAQRLELSTAEVRAILNKSKHGSEATESEFSKGSAEAGAVDEASSAADS